MPALRAVGRREHRERIACGCLRESIPLDLGQGPCLGAPFSVFYRSGRQIGQHGQWAFGFDFAPLAP